MRSGQSFTQLVEFSYGAPDGDVSWTLRDIAGDTFIDGGSVTPDPGAASVVLMVSGSLNVLGEADMIGGRELTWLYTVGGLEFSGTFRYTLEKPIPFPATPQGVRDKLGVEIHELPDASIPLMDAYLEYGEMLDLSAFATGTSRQIRLITNAIEALAGLAILPSLQIRLAAKEDSGTNAYTRYSKVDWVLLAEALRGHLAAASAEFVPSAGGGLLVLAGPDTDPVTGEAY